MSVYISNSKSNCDLETSDYQLGVLKALGIVQWLPVYGLIMV